MAQDTHWQLIEKILSGTATAREQRAFRGWLQQDERHVLIFEELQQVWNRSSLRFDPLLVYEKIHSKLLPARSHPRRGWRYVNAGKIAASLTMLLIAGSLLYSYRTKIVNQLRPVAYRIGSPR